MSEKKGPFDAAIDILMGDSNWDRDEGGNIVPTDNVAPAIRVLEAAGRVDKVKLHLRCGSLIRLTPELDALLESLPEKEEK